MDATLNPPTTSAATRLTEPVIVAGIASAEGRPGRLDFAVNRPTRLKSALLLLAGALVGAAGAIGITRLGKTAA